jgi:hypothetical protein
VNIRQTEVESSTHKVNCESSIARTGSTWEGASGRPSGTPSNMFASGLGASGLGSGNPGGGTALWKNSLAVQVLGCSGEVYGRIGRCSPGHAVVLGGGGGVGNPSPEMLEKGRFLLSSIGIGEGNASAGDLREEFSRAVSTLWPSLPSIWLIRSASSLMYLPSVSNVDRGPFLSSTYALTPYWAHASAERD